MPIYEYVCEPCERRFERLVQRFGDEVCCPSCEGQVERQLSTFAVTSSSGCLPATGGGGACCGGGCGRRHSH